jgi:hypothetical protein
VSKIPATASLLVFILTLLASPVDAQWPAGEPLQLFDGRVRLAGEVSATFGAKDDQAFFNYTDYERNALRTLRAALSGAWQPAERIALLGEVRSDDLDRIGAYAAYVRVRPWTSVPLDVQAGRIPPVFGSFGRRPYQSDQMLIGYPLAYQYLTSIRADALPGTADDLLQMRGRGWLSSFPTGSPHAGPGLPLVSSFRWDTGVQARWTMTQFEAAAAVTTGTLSNPRVTDDNGGKQLAARIAVRPLAGLVAGGSASHGAWISDDVFKEERSHAQTGFGADLEYSRDYWLIRSELVWSRWRMPFRTIPREGDRLGALAVWVEGRYRLTPRLYLAGRADRLSFSRITGAVFGLDTWDAAVTRFEVGGGYTVQRNLVLRAVAQMNRRDGGRIENRTFLSTQVAWWF